MFRQVTQRMIDFFLAVPLMSSMNHAFSRRDIIVRVI